MSWLAIVKAVLPHAGTLVQLAGPAFTKLKSKDQATLQPDLLQQQIGELQSAAVQNSEHIRELASQLQDTAKALEQAMLATESKLRRAQSIAIASMALAVVALTAALLVR